MADTSEIQVAQYLSFAIAGATYGLPIMIVKEILQHEETTRVPGTPPSIRGVINVRGQVVPVVDLAVKFGRGASAVSRQTCILVVEAALGGEPLTVGVLADAVNEVLDLHVQQIQPAPSFGANVRVDYLTGMGKVGNRFVLLLDAEKVLSASEVDLAGQVTAVTSATAPAEARA